MLYVATNDNDILEQISKIVLRKNSYFLNIVAFSHTLIGFISLEDHPNVVELLKKIIKVSDPELGVVKDIKSMLRESRKIAIARGN